MVTAIQYKHDDGDSSGSSRQFTFDRASRTGNAILVFIFYKGAPTVSSVTDSQSNAYVGYGGSAIARPTDGFLHCFGAKNITGGTLTVTVNWTGSVTSILMF